MARTFIEKSLGLKLRLSRVGVGVGVAGETENKANSAFKWNLTWSLGWAWQKCSKREQRINPRQWFWKVKTFSQNKLTFITFVQKFWLFWEGWQKMWLQHIWYGRGNGRIFLIFTCQPKYLQPINPKTTYHLYISWVPTIFSYPWIWVTIHK